MLFALELLTNRGTIRFDTNLMVNSSLYFAWLLDAPGPVKTGINNRMKRDQQIVYNNCFQST